MPVSSETIISGNSRIIRTQVEWNRNHIALLQEIFGLTFFEHDRKITMYKIFIAPRHCYITDILFVTEILLRWDRKKMTSGQIKKNMLFVFILLPQSQFISRNHTLSILKSPIKISFPTIEKKAMFHFGQKSFIFCKCQRFVRKKTCLLTSYLTIAR